VEELAGVIRSSVDADEEEEGAAVVVEARREVTRVLVREESAEVELEELVGCAAEVVLLESTKSITVICGAVAL
jgi:hypothetical protein